MSGGPGKSRKSRLSGVWSFFTKKTFDFKHSLADHDRQFANTLANRVVSARRQALPAPPPATRNQTEDAISRLAIGVSAGASDPFTAAVEGIRAEASIFSTTSAVRFEPPETLQRLAKHEAEDAPESMSSSQNTGGGQSPKESMTKTTTTATTRKRRRVTGADKAALSSILGWRLDGSGTGFGGISSFLKHQCITVLYYSPAQMYDAIDAKLSATRPASPFIGSPTATLTGVAAHLPKLAQWRTYRYYDEKESTLGQWIVESSEEAEISMHQRHSLEDTEPVEYTWMHLNWKLTARLEAYYSMNSDSVQVEGALDHDLDEIMVHMSCNVCNRETKKIKLNPGAW